MNKQPHRTVAGVDAADAASVTGILQERLVALLDLQLVLKHVHWNVVGPNFISVHEMLDQLVAEVRDQSDAVAERIRTLGGAPLGTPAAIVELRTWADYGRARDSVEHHLHDLDAVYDGVIGDHRRAIGAVGSLDVVTEDLLIGQAAGLELQQWFIRSFIEQPVPASAERFGAPEAGRGPTPAEDAAAERAADQIDLGEVGANYREMTATGAAVRGEGQIENVG